MEILIVGLEMVQDMEEKVAKIKHNLKVAHDRQKSYADRGRVFREFQIGDKVFLKVRGKKSSLNLRIYKKLATIFCGPFEVLRRVIPVAYEMALPQNVKVHNVFHVSLLRNYVHDPTHIHDWSLILVEPEGEIQVQPMGILDHRTKRLRKRTVGWVKVQWTHYSPEEATWESEEVMWAEYPYLF